jgi:hypothetical protein
MHFATMAGWLEPAKVQFAGSAHLTDHLEPVNLTAEQRSFLKELPDAMFRESVRDFMVNQQFRRDHWVRGARKMSALEQREALRAYRVMLGVPAADVPAKVQTQLGEATLNTKVTSALMEALSDHRPASLAELELRLAEKDVAYANLLEVVVILVGSGHLQPVQDEAAIAASTPQAHALNRTLMHRARTQADISHLASPVTGGGVTVGRFAQMFLTARAEGLTEPEQWAGQVWEVLRTQGQRLIKDGKALDDPQENLAEIERQAKDFMLRQLPVLQALRVTPEKG